MEDKINDDAALNDFALKLVDKLFDEGLIDDKENIPDDITDMIIEAMRVESKKQ